MSLRGKLPSLKDKAIEELKKETKTKNPEEKLKVAPKEIKLGKKNKK